MNTTAKQLVDHWTWAADKGLMNRNTAGALRAACSQVLGVLDNWEQLDVTSLNVEDVLRRFQNLRARDFSPESLNAYARRFRNAVESFLQYVKDPASWKPAARAPKTQTEGNGKPDVKRRKTAPAEQADEFVVANETPHVGGLIEYPFPLRDNVVARLKLPRDISAAEAKRLYGFMIALAVDATNAA
jgi:hypothetical protein